MAGIDWWWVFSAIVLDLLVYACAAWEWQLLLRPIGSLTFRQTLHALFAGRFANDVLPLHAGYIIRVYLASRWSGSSIAAVIPSLLIERLFDVSWLALGIGLTTLFFPLPEKFARTGEILGGIILVSTALVTWTIFHRRTVVLKPSAGSSSRQSLWSRIEAFLQPLAAGLRSLSGSQLTLAALGLSIAKLILQSLAFLSLLWAFAFPFPIRIKLAVFLIAYIGISTPSTPAGIGVFQLICAAGLRFFGVPKPAASGFALLAYVVLTAPLALAGAIAFARSGLTLQQIRHEIRQWQREVK